MTRYEMNAAIYKQARRPTAAHLAPYINHFDVGYPRVRFLALLHKLNG